ncbi:MAG: YjjW family glycine radical enzyme activase [Salinivirgaceae bacterium]|nr:YjjW family glycine radical enzyme activase [Salinivirgaceae bacterium]
MFGVINKSLNHSSVDGPGNRLVIFFQGCNFSCSYCHNPETIKVCNNCGICIAHCSSNALSMKDKKIVWNQNLCVDCGKCILVCPNSSSPKTQLLSVSDIIQQIEKVQHFISGITISGGECTQQYYFLKELLIACKQQNISAFIDTNAHLEFEKMKELSQYFDKAMPDVKIYSNHQHRQLTGKANELVFQNIEFLLQAHKVHEIRSVIYPEFDYTETIEKVSQLIASYDHRVIYKLIKFRPHGLNNKKSPSDEIMLFLKTRAEHFGCSNIIIS